MKILTYSLLTVEWVCDYCGDSGKNNKRFTWFGCWSVLPRGPREFIGYAGSWRSYILQKVPHSLVKCLNRHQTVAKLVGKNVLAEVILFIEASKCNVDFTATIG